MAFTTIIDSATISTTEYSLPADTTTGVPTAQTDDCILSGSVQVAACAVGDEFRVRIYEKTNGQTATVLWESTINGVQPGALPIDPILLTEGWDLTVLKESGTDRVVHWSLRKTTEAIGTGAIVAASFAAGAIDASAIAADAIGSAELATSAVDEIVDAVWDEALAGHSTAGTAGKALADAGGGSSPATIADAVWDETRSGHVTAGTFGESVAGVVGNVAVGSIVAGAVTAAAIATDAIGAAELAADAVAEISAAIAAFSPPTFIKRNVFINTDRDIMFMMVDSATGLGATGKTITTTFSKNGAAFAGIAPSTVTELTSGWYKVALTSAAGHTNTLGDLAMHATAAGCVAFDGVVAEIINALVVDNAAIAAAVWASFCEGTLTYAQLNRILLAVAAGNATGLEGSSPAFISPVDDVTTRVGATYAGGVRTNTTLNGT